MWLHAAAKVFSNKSVYEEHRAGLISCYMRELMPDKFLRVSCIHEIVALCSHSSAKQARLNTPNQFIHTMSHSMHLRAVIPWKRSFSIYHLQNTDSGYSRHAMIAFAKHFLKIGTLVTKLSNTQHILYNTPLKVKNSIKYGN